MEEVKPPVRPRVEQAGEKLAAIAFILLVLGLIIYAIIRKRPLDLEAMAEVFPGLAWAALLTIGLTTVSYFGGMLLGLVWGWLRTSKRRPLRATATTWVESFRGTPLFVQMFLLAAFMSYYSPRGLPIASRVLLTGALALFLNTSAYQAEIFRAGLQSVHAGQVEAASSIGLSHWGAMRHVILPQAFRVVVPPLMNEYIALLKASSLLAIIGVHELTYRAKIATSFGQPWLEIYAIVTLLYIAMTVPLAKIVLLVERRIRIPGLGMQQEPSARKARTAKSVAARVAGFDRAALRNVLTRHPDVPATHGADVRGGGRGHRQEAGPDRRPGVRAALPP